MAQDSSITEEIKSKAVETDLGLIKKLNEYIGTVYTVEIKSSTEVYVDDYENGEGEHRNSWSNDKTMFHVEPENLQEELKDQMEDYIDNVLYANYKEKYLKDSLNNQSEEDEGFWYSNFVDLDNTTPSKSQIDNWKKGKEELFVQSINISVSVNGKNLNCELLKELLITKNKETSKGISK